MTPQELRTAADSILMYRTATSRNAVECAEHVLRTVHSDDDDDLTDKWFFDHGLQFEPRSQCFYLKNHIGITKERGGYWFFSNEDGPGWELKKCGQFRGLCHVLNVPLTVQDDSGIVAAPPVVDTAIEAITQPLSSVSQLLLTVLTKSVANQPLTEAEDRLLRYVKLSVATLPYAMNAFKRSTDDQVQPEEA